jgi:hypothetical protein
VARRLALRFPNLEVRMRYPRNGMGPLMRYRMGEGSLEGWATMLFFQHEVSVWGTLRERIALSQTSHEYWFDLWLGEDANRRSEAEKMEAKSPEITAVQ